MNNKKSKIETFTSVSDLVKSKKTKVETSASVSDLVKSKKTEIETSASLSDLIKSKKNKTETSTSISDLIKSKPANSIKPKRPNIADLIKPKKRYLYPCHCIRCDGTEVDFRTQENHAKDKSLWNSEDARKNQEDTIIARKQKKSIIIQDVNPTKKRKRSSGPNPDSQQNSRFDPDPFSKDTDLSH
jgi:predicted outer membrane protein